MPPVFQKFKRIKTQLGGGSATDVDAPFDVECACGARVTGLRRATWVEAECPECCHGVFVLPVNVYPATPSVNSEILGGTFSERLKTVVSEMMPEKTPPAPAHVKQEKRKLRPGETVAVEAVDTAEEVRQPRPKMQLPKLRMPKIDVKAALRKTFTPFRLLMLSMVVVVGLTGWWMTYQKRVEAAQQTWLRSAEDVDELMAEADLIKLEATLQQAVDAGYTLGKQDSEWRSWLNLLHETKAVNSMATADLLTDFAAAYDDQNRLVGSASEQMTSAATSGWFVFDAWLTEATDQSDVYLMEFPAAPGRHAVDVYIPLPQIANLTEHAGDERIVFAATFERVDAPGLNKAWSLLVAADSFVLMTSATHCHAVGFNVEDDADLAAIINRQQEFVQSSEAWEHRADESITPSVFAKKTVDSAAGWNDE